MARSKSDPTGFGIIIFVIIIGLLKLIYDYFMSVDRAVLFLGGSLILIVPATIWVLLKMRRRAVEAACEREYLERNEELRLKQRRAESERRIELGNKYDDDELLIQRILDNECWSGQTESQLVDSMGTPDKRDIDTGPKRTREVWKYLPRGARSYDLSITLIDGVVTRIVDKRD